MSIAIALLVAASPLVRTPDKSAAPRSEAGQFWVYFTDKGVFDNSSLSAALDASASFVTREAAVRRRFARAGMLDFDDLPLRTGYVREVGRLGGRLRRISRWLNAASFDLPAALVPTVHALPFVYSVRPVATGAIYEPVPFSLGRGSNAWSRELDTADARRFYGPSYDQAEMMGVPEVFFRGHFGAGVRLGIFDTGLRLANRAVARMRLWKQHDFLSGDNALVCRSAAGWNMQPVPNLVGFGLVHSPVLAAQVEPLGTDTTATILAFAADSFSYGYGLPRRAIFASVSLDDGVSWSSAQPVTTASRPADVTFEELVTATNRRAVYLAYVELAANASGPASPAVYLGFFDNTAWQPVPGYTSTGRCPSLACQRDTLYFAFARQDSLLCLRRYDVAGSAPGWLAPEVVTSVAEPIGGTLARATAAAVDVFVTGLYSGLVRQFRSTDGGLTFDTGRVVVPAGARAVRLAETPQGLALLYASEAVPPLGRLSVQRSTDQGATWTAGTPVVDSVPTVGSCAALPEGTAGLSVFYELAGFPYRAVTTDLGLTWTTAGPLDTAGFCYLPAAVGSGSSSVAAWFKRGDDNSVWETSDEARFSREQPHHGTRMASLIAGYQPGGIIGIAPGVDLLVARTELYKTRSGRFYEYNMEEDAYIEALEWAEAAGADIVSSSLGYRGWYGDDEFDGRTAPISVAADKAAARGLVIVTAMGNRDTTLNPWPEPYIVAPGDAEHVITAGGVEKTGVMWRGTGSGPTADGRTKPDLVALSDTVTVVSPDSLDWLDGSVGTSCATALIAGACALVKEIHPDWDSDSIRAVMYSTATRAVKSCTLGFGVPRVDSVYRLYPGGKDHPDVPGDRISVVYPNPFTSGTQTRVYFALDLTQPTPEPDSTQPEPVESPVVISIFSASGMLVDTLGLNTHLMGRPGRYGTDGDVATLDAIGAWWDGRNTAGQPVASGIYAAVLQTTFGRHVAKFALVR